MSLNDTVERLLVQRIMKTIDVTHHRFRRYATCMDREEVMRVLRAFESAGLEYVLIGAAAMGFHGLVRATEALDLFIRATPENIEKLRSVDAAALRERFSLKDEG